MTDLAESNRSTGKNLNLQLKKINKLPKSSLNWRSRTEEEDITEDLDQPTGPFS